MGRNFWSPSCRESPQAPPAWATVVMPLSCSCVGRSTPAMARENGSFPWSPDPPAVAVVVPGPLEPQPRRARMITRRTQPPANTPVVIISTSCNALIYAPVLSLSKSPARKEGSPPFARCSTRDHGQWMVSQVSRASTKCKTVKPESVLVVTINLW